jgi:hypothetical protein
VKIWIPLLIVLMLAASGWYFFTQRQEAPEPPLPVAVEEPKPAVAVVEEEAPLETPEPPAPEPLPVAEPVEALEPLPALADSDPLARDILGSFYDQAAVMRYFADQGLVSRLVATVDALGSKQVPGAIQVMQGPEGTFAARRLESPQTPILNAEGDPVPQFVIEPSNAGRYLLYVEMLESIDVATFVATYRRNYPLFQEAWRELGYTEGEFDNRLLQVIDELLAAPEAPEPLVLIKPEAFYLFADERLESLSAGQKILLRMGNDHARRVKARLSEFRGALVRD